MNPIERPGTNAAGIRPNAAAPVARPAAPRGVATAADQAESGATASVGRMASAGDTAPVDTDRVAVIRKAVEEGRYPVLPARIADAMIAAGYLLRTK